MDLRQVTICTCVGLPPQALVQLQALYHHCGEAASEKCLSAATFVRHRRGRAHTEETSRKRERSADNSASPSGGVVNLGCSSKSRSNAAGSGGPAGTNRYLPNSTVLKRPKKDFR